MIRWVGLKPVEIVLLLGASLLVLAASYLGWWTIGITEAWGFATGGVCVWLVVREHIWNWPIGLANNLVFFVLFLQSRLYADMLLQLLYSAIAIRGWINWHAGVRKRGSLPITRMTRSEWIGAGAVLILGTTALRYGLLATNGAAPLWDALTTTLSLVAQYLLTKKRFENWYFWIAADLIYIPLYLFKVLPLTAALYGIFLIMCLTGLRTWAHDPRPAAAAS